MSCAGGARCPEVSFSALERKDGEEGLSLLEDLPDRQPLPEEMTESSVLGHRRRSVSSNSCKLWHWPVKRPYQRIDR